MVSIGRAALHKFCPIFAPETLNIYSDEENFNIDEPYIFAYILDPNPKIGACIQRLANESGKKVVVVFNQSGDKEKLRGQLEISGDNVIFLNDPTVKEWLYLFKNAGYVITDSFHGMCFSIIFRKPFIVRKNNGRGGSRFPYLLGEFGLMDRMVESSDVIAEKFFSEGISPIIDYDNTTTDIEKQKQASIAWLEAALNGKKFQVTAQANIENKNNLVVGKPAELDQKASSSYKKSAKKRVPVEPKQADVLRCRMVAAILRDYGIRHVVCSSGTRHMHLVGYFEQNDCFITHNVIDERSASFFALGIATKLNEPVAICCTSGTAAANYLSACEEAYYQHLPLIVLTTDRYEYLLNQREDQMIPQHDIYGSVCLKSVTLPIIENSVSKAVTRRMICEAILEATHYAPGPVHINIPIQTIVRQPNEYYYLDGVKYSIINRHYMSNDKSSWKLPALELKKSSKVLILYGQNGMLSEREKKIIETFAERYNCVILTDHLSNLSCSKVISYYNTTKSDNLNESIIKEIKPDIVITMNGASVGFISTVAKLPGVVHWDISPNGAIADPYHRIERCFQASAIQFFKRMSILAGQDKASTSYYELWKKYEKKEDDVPKKFIQRYAVYHTIKHLPDDCLLHISNSNTIRMSCAYSIKPSIEVFCNRGTNGIDGSASSFFGQASVTDKLCFLMIGDLSFFYDMNSLWNKDINGRIRIILFNNSCADMLKRHKLKAITHSHNAKAEAWVKSVGFTYLSASNKEEFDKNIERFVSDEDTPMFFEVFC